MLLAAAGLTLIIGWSLAREEREVLVEKDEESLKTFASGMRNGVDSLEKNFDRTLLDLCRKLDPGGSDRGMVTLAKTYAGVRQVSVVQPGKLGREPRVIKSLEIGGGYPLPILSGRAREVIDLERLDDPGVTYFWVADARDGLQVIDSGRGISTRNRERIFKPFARLSRRVNEGVSGSGLGLAISRDLARAINGELVCRERPDGRPGACFELRLELAEEKVVPFETKVS